MRTFVYYVADFETTVYDNQYFTEVWASALAELWDDTNHVEIKTSLQDFMRSLFSRNQNMVIYFHNLKFDGSFILDWIKKQPSFHEKIVLDGEKNEHFAKDYKLRHKDYIYQISSKGVFYSITINYRGYLYVFYDSYKIIPFSVAQIGKAFDTKNRKTTIEYTGFRKAFGLISEQEKEYIKNDVLVMKEALEKMFNMGLTSQTIGSSALKVFKSGYDKEDLELLFPQVYDIPIDINKYGQDNVGEYIHKSYHGAWCFCNPVFKDKIIYDGVTVDANSLYPSQMRLKKFPVGLPKFFSGEPPVEALQEDKLYFIRIKCRFELKSGYLPFIQIKGDMRYNGREMLESNIVYDKYGNILQNEQITFTMTCIDYTLFKEHYNLYDLQFLDGCYFKAVYGLFDEYIDNFMQMKIESKNIVERTIAKLLLNNLYGKFAMYKDSSFKVAFLEENKINFRTVREMDKVPTYIPIGSFITSYARDTTIRLAQKNIKHFCYADTDSLHCCCNEKELVDVPIHDKKLGFWKVELRWKRGIFHRQKSYVESEIIDGKEEYHVTCAGMGKEVKQTFINALKYRDGSITTQEILSLDKYDKIQKGYMLRGADLSDFKTGLTIYGNLKAKRIIGGIILVKCPFRLRG